MRQLLAFFLPQFFLLALIASFRFVGADEGFYAIAVRLVMQGDLPYRDFFYPQMPLFPYLYGLPLSLLGYSWEIARLVTALFAALTGSLLAVTLLRKRGMPHAIAGILLFLSSELTLGWFTVVKPYALTGLLCFFSYYLLQRADRTRTHLLLSGLSIGCAVATRAYMCTLIPVFLIYLWLQTKPQEQRLSHLFSFICGGLLIGVPLLGLSLYVSDEFWFNNLGYHQLRSDLGFSAALRQKHRTLRALLGYGKDAPALSFQFLLLSAGFVLLWLQQRKSISLAQACSLTIIITSFLPTPTWVQYFSLAVPFLILATLEQLEMHQVKRFPKTCVLVLLLYLGMGLPHAYRFTVTGNDVHAVPPKNPQSMRPATITEVSSRLNEITAPGELVASRWPGYLFASHALPLPGMENQYWARVYKKLSDEDRKRFHIASPTQIQEQMRTGLSGTIVLGRRTRAMWETLIPELKFREMLSLSGHRIYQDSERTALSHKARPDSTNTVTN